MRSYGPQLLLQRLRDIYEAYFASERWQQCMEDFPLLHKNESLLNVTVLEKEVKMHSDDDCGY